MSRINKLWKKFQGFGIVTYHELVKLMAHHGFEEYKKGKGSSRKFENKDGLQFAMHEQHPEKDLKTYQKLAAKKFINDYIIATKEE